MNTFRNTRRDGRIAAAMAPLLFALLAACAADDDFATTFDDSGGRFTVTFLDADWVRFDDRRIPLDQFILETRQRLRRTDASVIKRQVVHILYDDSAPDTAEVQAAADRLVLQLGLAGVRQVSYL